MGYCLTIKVVKPLMMQCDSGPFLGAAELQFGAAKLVLLQSILNKASFDACIHHLSSCKELPGFYLPKWRLNRLNPSEIP